LGWFVANQRQLGRIEEEYAGLAVLGFLAFAIDMRDSKSASARDGMDDKSQRPISGMAA